MTGREFESLLTAYLDGHVRDEEIAQLAQAIEECPEFKARLQQELRLHTLMREAASAQRELNGLSTGRILPFRRMPSASLCVAVAASAACVLLAVLLVITLHGRDDPAVPVIGRFLQVGGTVHATVGADQTSVLVRDSQTIREGDRIVCDSDMRSLIELTGGTLLSLEGGSTVTIERNRSDDIEIFVERGKALFEVAEQAPGERCVVVRTPQATATVLGTLFSVEAQATWTRTDVYEGRVRFRQEQTGDEVQVGMSQSAETWADGPLRVKELTARRATLSSPEMVLSPTADMYTCEGSVVNEDVLYVEGERRTTYLKFEVPLMQEIRTARLQLTQLRDVGRGTLSFYEGSHSEWAEQDQGDVVHPERLRQIAQFSGVIGFNQTVEVDVSNLITQPGLYTIVVILDASGNDDISFGSRETGLGPRLVLNESYHEPESNAAALPGQTPGESRRYRVLSPTDDVCLDRGQRVNREYLHLEKNRRRVFLRFEIPGPGAIEEARLQLTQVMDPGSGTIRFHEGSHSDWTERDLKAELAPVPVREIARYTGVVGPFDTISVDVSDLIAGPGRYTIMATVDSQGTEDIAFGSKEGDFGPKLILKRQRQQR